MSENSPKTRAWLFAVVGPGILVAATGVGAGDLATASLAGSMLGVQVLWAVVLGAGLKYALNEGLARWQLASGDTLLEGCVRRLGTPFKLVFGAYLFLWSYFVGAALVAACGATAHALIPVFSHVGTGKVVFGILHSLLGIVLVRAGGYRLFEKLMTVCIGVMFVTVVTTAFVVAPWWNDAAELPAAAAGSALSCFRGEGLTWTVALIGGVGGTLTVICYGYWMREEGWEGGGALNRCRADLAVGYAMTALFGMAMVIIGSRIHIGDARGASLIVRLGERLALDVHPIAKYVFLLGAWGAVFSSLLGVWQSVPYVFADFVGLARGEAKELRRRRLRVTSRTYTFYLYLLGTLPLVSLAVSFVKVQKFYAVFGACFMPFLAVVLLYLNGRRDWVGARHRNGPVMIAVLAFTLAFFGWIACVKLADAF